MRYLENFFKIRAEIPLIKLKFIVENILYSRSTFLPSFSKLQNQKSRVYNDSFLLVENI